MQGPFLDTNIFLRHLLDDDPAHSPACHALFQSIEQQDLTAWTSALAIAEIVFVLSNPKTYGVDRVTIRDTVLPLLGLSHLKLERKQLYARVFELYTAHPIDYIDAYHAALVEHSGQKDIYSYDRHFDVVAGLSRVEPQGQAQNDMIS
jgi:predicted nucleic acid-binding protein